MPRIKIDPDRKVTAGRLRDAMPGAGAPSKFNPALFERICGFVREWPSLRAACKMEGMPGESTVRSWLAAQPPEIYAQFMQAKEQGYLAMGEELLEIADDGSNDWMEIERQNGRIDTVLDREHVARSQLRVDTRKWILSQMLPKVYGKTVKVTGPDGGPIEMNVLHENLSERIARIAAGKRAPILSGEPEPAGDESA